jgi:hypothetical protein
MEVMMALSDKAAKNKDELGGDGSAFQHRHYAFVASVIKAMPSFAESLRTQKQSCALAFSEAFSRTNPRFNRIRFLRACAEDTD